MEHLVAPSRTSSRSSSRGSSRRSAMKHKKTKANTKNMTKSVKFDHSAKNGGPTMHTNTLQKSCSKGKRKRQRQRKPLTPQDRGVVGYIRYLNKSLLSLFCLRFLTPEIHNYSNHIAT